MNVQKDALRLEVRPEIRVRSPRELLIFSLDDTLIDTSLYWLARAAFARTVAEKSGKIAAGLPEGWGPENESAYEAMPRHDSVTMHDTWETFQKMCNLPADCDSDLYLLMARSLQGKFPAAIAGAEDLLKWAQSRFTLALLTSGSSEVQVRKLEGANLGSYFKQVKVVPSKGPEDFLGLMSEMGFSPRNSWAIGSSVRKDINPGIAAGANCIHYSMPQPRRDGAREDIEEPARPVFRIRALSDARAILAKPSDLPASVSK